MRHSAGILSGFHLMGLLEGEAEVFMRMGMLSGNGNRKEEQQLQAH